MYANVKAEIVEQPDSTSLRFRYESEGPTAGSIVGVNSTEKGKTYPSIRILNYDGPALVIVSCVTADGIPKPHPNQLTGKYCKNGVYKRQLTLTTTPAQPEVIELKNVGIQYVKKELIKTKLEQRKTQKIDPFNTGFDHKLNSKSIDMHMVRLCFQVYLKPDADDPYKIIPLSPLISNLICHKQSKNNLNILEVSDCSGTANGGKVLMLFCERVKREDIEIKFFEKDAEGNLVWEELVKPKTVHKQVAISFVTPKYRVQNIDGPVNVFFRLQKINDDRVFGDSTVFTYVPDPGNIGLTVKSKKHKGDDSVETNKAVSRQKFIGNTNNMDAAVNTENIAPQNHNFGASNFDLADNKLPLQLQQHDNGYPQRQREQQFQSDYQWRLYNPFQNLQPYNLQPQQSNSRNDFQTKQCQDRFSHQKHYHTQNEMHRNYSHYSSYSCQSNIRNVNGGTNNLNTSSITNNFNLQSQPIGNYQAPAEQTHYPIQSIGYGGDQVRIQQFSNNQVALNNQQNGIEILPNLFDYCLSGDSG